MARMAVPVDEAVSTRTISGRAFGVGFALACVGLVAAIVFVAPRLQDLTAAQLGPVADRDVLATGVLDGTAWSVVAELVEGRSCLVTELDGRRATEICAAPEMGALGDVGVTTTGEGSAYLLTGLTDQDLRQVQVELSQGESPRPRVYRERGYEAGFFYTTVAPGASVERIVALNRNEQPIAVRACDDGPVARADGPGQRCATRAVE